MKQLGILFSAILLLLVACNKEDQIISQQNLKDPAVMTEVLSQDKNFQADIVTVINKYTEQTKDKEEFIQYLKGFASEKLYDNYPDLETMTDHEIASVVFTAGFLITENSASANRGHKWGWCGRNFWCCLISIPRLREACFQRNCVRWTKKCN